MKRTIAITALALLLGSGSLRAQEDRTPGIIRSALMGLEYEVKAGVNIGGASPLPLPEEIRRIDSYSPTFCFALEGDVVKWLGVKKRWGVVLGLRLETKGMQTGARTKNYGMEIIGDGGERLKGNWTGRVRTKYRGTFLSVPLLAACKLNPRLRLQMGPYVSFRTSGDFSGYVYDGYLRENDPTGNKVEFEGDKRATYDFSDDLRTVQWGVQAGVNWKAFRHLTLSADLLWGLNDIFKKEFETVTFDMYPIYLNIGFGYAF
jgi:hypothetical protein